MAGRNIKKHQFIGAGLAVTTGQFHRIACITQTHKIDTFHHPALGHVEAGNQTKSDHVS